MSAKELCVAFENRMIEVRVAFSIFTVTTLAPEAGEIKLDTIALKLTETVSLMSKTVRYCTVRTY